MWCLAHRRDQFVCWINLKVKYFPLHIGSVPGFREGCGLAAFHLEEDAVQRIKAEGIVF